MISLPSVSVPRGPRRPRRARTSIVLAASLVVTAIACGNADPPDLGEEAAPTTTEAPTTTTTTTAASFTTTVVTTAATSVEVFAAPDDPEPALTVEKPGPGLQAPADPLAFVVQAEQDDWVQVQVPVRPNGTTGWIRAEGLETATTDLRMEVSLGWHTFKLFDGDELLMDAPVAIGAEDSPTPVGTFFTTTLMQGYPQPSAYGIAAIGLSGFSEVLESFSGGPPQIAIHGTYDEAKLGTNVSNGCIRVSNADIQRIIDQLPQHLGVPVVIAP